MTWQQPHAMWALVDIDVANQMSRDGHNLSTYVSDHGTLSTPFCIPCPICLARTRLIWSLQRRYWSYYMHPSQRLCKATNWTTKIIKSDINGEIWRFKFKFNIVGRKIKELRFKFKFCHINKHLKSLLAHTSHWLQPLDVSVFSLFKTFFKKERAVWLARFPNVEIRRAKLAEIGSKSLNKALIVSNIVAGFRRTKIWHINPDALMDDMQPNTTFNIQNGEDVSTVQNMLSLSGVDVSSEAIADYIAKRVTDNVEDCLALPSQWITLTWLAKGAMALGVDLEGEHQDSTFTFPSPLVTAMDDVVHYYADCGISNSQPHAELTQQDTTQDTTQVGSEEDEILLSQVSGTGPSQQEIRL